MGKNRCKPSYSSFVSDFIAANTTSSSIQQMWDDFKIKCLDCLEVVHTNIQAESILRLGLPPTQKGYAGKLYNKARSSGSIADWTKFKR